jgi:hypothetical protein
MQTLDIHNLKANDIIRKCVCAHEVNPTHCPTVDKSGKLLSKIRNARTFE